MARSKWQYYQWDPCGFLSSRSVRKLDGLVIAIIRAFHDQLWMSEEKQILDSDTEIALLLDVQEETWHTAKVKALGSGALYRIGGFLRSPHIDDCWQHCQRRSQAAAESVSKRRDRLGA